MTTPLQFVSVTCESKKPTSRLPRFCDWSWAVAEVARNVQMSNAISPRTEVNAPRTVFLFVFFIFLFFLLVVFVFGMTCLSRPQTRDDQECDHPNEEILRRAALERKWTTPLDSPRRLNNATLFHPSTAEVFEHFQFLNRPRSRPSKRSGKSRTRTITRTSTNGQLTIDQHPSTAPEDCRIGRNRQRYDTPEYATCALAPVSCRHRRHRLAEWLWRRR